MFHTSCVDGSAREDYFVDVLGNLVKRLVVLLVIAPACASAATIVRFNFLSNFTAAEVTSGVVATGFSSGSAITEVTLEIAGQPPQAWHGENWTISDDPAIAFGSDSYVWFQVTPEPGMVMTLSGLVLDVQPHGSGPRDFAVSVVDVSSGLGAQMGGIMLHSDQSVFDGSRKTWETLSVSSQAFQNVAGTHEIRIYGFDAQRADREVLFDNVTLEGTVSLVPEPSVLSLLFLSAVFLLCRRSGLLPAPTASRDNSARAGSLATR